ncbi:AAEL010310-PA, partial [Aedes aegypti]
DGTYRCQFCDKTFPRLGYLKKHEQVSLKFCWITICMQMGKGYLYIKSMKIARSFAPPLFYGIPLGTLFGSSMQRLSHTEHMPFKCEYCARLFKHKRSRDRHTKLHTGDRRYRCPHCEAAFSRSDHLKIHMKTHDNQKPFQCTICNRGYNTAAALTSHMQNHKKQIALTGSPNLTYSPRSTSSLSSSASNPKRKFSPYEQNLMMVNRSKLLKSGELSCMYCTQNDFSNIEQLGAHVQSMHSNILLNENNFHRHTPDSFIPFPPVSCEFCTMKFPSVPLMLNHLKTSHLDKINNTNNYLEQLNKNLMSTYTSFYGAKFFDEKHDTEEQPEVKNERSPSEKSLKDENGNDEAPAAEESNQNFAPGSILSNPPGAYLCNQCNAALPDFESFRTHLKAHLEQGAATSSFLCQQCGITLGDQQDYEKHVTGHYIITSTEYVCDPNCSKAFSKTEELHKHLYDSHTQVIYKCILCKENFDSKVTIQVHYAVAHSNEVKLYRCSACAEAFRSEREFRNHIRSRHITPGAVQCVFCRVVCSSELEMQFHLAAHARKFKCPACPESFHVEFLLDRHMQTHHSHKEISNATAITPSPVHSVGNTNNLDYLQLQGQMAAAAAGWQNFPNNAPPSKALLNLYNQRSAAINGLYSPDHNTPNTGGSSQSASSSNSTGTTKTPHIYSPTTLLHRYSASTSGLTPTTTNAEGSSAGSDKQHASNSNVNTSSANYYSCGICERNDFGTENEAQTHRKIVHNLKTGVSLRCAYCSGDFRSRNELENHMKITHNTGGKHKCLICDEIFPSPAVLAEHKLTHCKVGASGRCSHCSTTLPDAHSFKAHLTQHHQNAAAGSTKRFPIQCICCRQTLNSEFEISLHAKFHTKSDETNERTCALCLEPLSSSQDTKICESCLKRHNFPSKLLSINNLIKPSLPPTHQHHAQHTQSKCNLCKKHISNAQKLQEHLIDHTFAGCEDRGYVCYLCSSVFTSSSGLQNHISEHGPQAKPYDCNHCDEAFYFRAELEHHLINHEL